MARLDFPHAPSHFRELETLVKVPFSVVPMPFTATMITKAIADAIKPYSMAVAPDSFLMKEEITFIFGLRI